MNVLIAEFEAPTFVFLMVNFFPLLLHQGFIYFLCLITVLASLRPSSCCLVWSWVKQKGRVNSQAVWHTSGIGTAEPLTAPSLLLQTRPSWGTWMTDPPSTPCRVTSHFPGLQHFRDWKKKKPVAPGEMKVALELLRVSRPRTVNWKCLPLLPRVFAVLIGWKSWSSGSMMPSWRSWRRGSESSGSILRSSVAEGSTHGMLSNLLWSLTWRTRWPPRSGRWQLCLLLRLTEVWRCRSPSCWLYRLREQIRWAAFQCMELAHSSLWAIWGAWFHHRSQVKRNSC